MLCTSRANVCVSLCAQGRGTRGSEEFPPVNGIRNVCAHVQKNGKAEKKMLVCAHKCM